METSMSHWTVIKDGKEYAIPREVELLDPAEREAAVATLIAEAEDKTKEADRLFGAAPIKEEE